MTYSEVERIRELEVKVESLTDKIEEMDGTLTELRDLLVGARGARWMLGLLIAIGSFAGGSLIQSLIPFIFKK